MLARICAEEEIPGCVTGIGSIFNLHFTSELVKDYETSMSADKRAGRIFDLLMLDKGIDLAPLHSSFCSAPMDKRELDHFETAARETLREMKALCQRRSKGVTER